MRTIQHKIVTLLRLNMIRDYYRSWIKLREISTAIERALRYYTLSIGTLRISHEDSPIDLFSVATKRIKASPAHSSVSSSHERIIRSVSRFPRGALASSRDSRSRACSSSVGKRSVPPLTSLIVISHLRVGAWERTEPRYGRGWIAMIYEDRRSGAQAGL